MIGAIPITEAYNGHALVGELKSILLPVMKPSRVSSYYSIRHGIVLLHDSGAFVGHWFIHW